MKKTKEQQKRIDYFAGLAMQSLILIYKNDIKCHYYKVGIENITFKSIEISEFIVEQLDKNNHEQ